MSPATRVLPFYFDFVSPFAYLAWKAAPVVLEPLGVTLRPIPVLFAGILNALGQKGPAEIPAKRVWVWKTVVRRARDAGLAIAPPPSHPFNPLLALRMCSLDLPEPERARMIDLLFDETWGAPPAGVTKTGIETPDAIARALGRSDLDAASYLSAAASADAKARLRTQTEDALARGVFGVPTFLVGEEAFWGHDSIPDLVRHLRGEDPLRAEDLTAWAMLPATASRL